MPIAEITVGLPGSGKSFYADNKVAKDGNWVQVNRDSLRTMLIADKWTSKKEREVIIPARDQMIRLALKAGKNVIISDTNLVESSRNKLVDWLKTLGATVIVNDSFLDVSVDTCLERDAKRPNGVGADVIWKMYYQAFRRDDFYVADTSKPKAVIVDIDGTLAYIKDNSRGHYDWAKVAGDAPNQFVIDTVRALSTDFAILIFSGRDSEAKPGTIKWLVKHNVYYDGLFMRKQGDMRKDSIIKRELFDAIRDDYNVQFVIDDREQVVTGTWEPLGLHVLQVRTPGVYPKF